MVSWNDAAAVRRVAGEEDRQAISAACPNLNTNMRRACGTTTAYPWAMKHRQEQSQLQRLRQPVGRRGKQRRLVRSRRTSSVSTTWSEMSGSGTEDCYHDNYNGAPNSWFGLDQVAIAIVVFCAEGPMLAILGASRSASRNRARDHLPNFSISASGSEEPLLLETFIPFSLGVWSRDEVTRVDNEGRWVFRPGAADGLEWRFPPQRLEVLC